MGVFNKLASILFDEVDTEEIPVITKSKDEKDDLEKINHSKWKEIKDEKDEVIIKKIEKNALDDEMFDEMPKFSEKKEEKKVEEKKESKFTFPLIDDDEDLEEKHEEDRNSRFRRDNNVRREDKNSRSSSYGYDYLSTSNYKKSDSYTTSRNNIYDRSYDDKKPFTPSPVISPVWGVLNENYRKEDISVKDSSANRSGSVVDLDEVRRRAYGTLEDEIEVSLNTNVILDNEKHKDDLTLDTLSDNGLSVDELLAADEKEMEEDNTEEVLNNLNVDTEKEELFEIEDADEEIDLDDDKETVLDIEEKKDNKKEKKDNTEDSEEDLFDLIDSIYAGKDEEE